MEDLLNNQYAKIAIYSVIILLSAFILHQILKLAVKCLSKRNVVPAKNVLMINRAASIIVYTIAVFSIATQIEPLKNMAVAALASSGVLVVVLGLAAQQTLGNLISGIMLTFNKPFGIGDFITVSEKNVSGFVEDTNVLHIVLRTFENNRIIVPNSFVSGAILENTSFTDERHCSFLALQIDASSDIDLAIKIISEEIQKHESFLDTRTPEEKDRNLPSVFVRLAAMENGCVTLRTAVWTKTFLASFAMLPDLRHSIKKRFDLAQIELFLPKQHLYLEKETKN